MRIDIITLFPDLFTPFLKQGVTSRAFGGAIDLRIWQLRDFASGPYRRIDDRPFGGGPGMVMQAEPLAQCIESILKERGISVPSAGTPLATQQSLPILLFSPIGRPLTHSTAQQWANSSTGGIWICGRYEGIDQRLIDQYVTEQVSLGDFVLSGGEIAALALLDASARLLPGVLGNEEGHAQDSFNPELGGLLDCPHYTRPAVWRGQTVPPVLLSGNHAAIAAWRKEQSLALTQRHRPDLLDAPKP